jgi:hypothetical protein
MRAFGYQIKAALVCRRLHVNGAALPCESTLERVGLVAIEPSIGTTTRWACCGVGLNMRITSKIKILLSPPGLILPEREQSPPRREENQNAGKQAEAGGSEYAGARDRR